VSGGYRSVKPTEYKMFAKPSFSEYEQIGSLFKHKSDDGFNTLTLNITVHHHAGSIREKRKNIFHNRMLKNCAQKFQGCVQISS
jgi:hypothetical protein